MCHTPATAGKRRSWRTYLECLGWFVADQLDLELDRLPFRHAYHGWRLAICGAGHRQQRTAQNQLDQLHRCRCASAQCFSVAADRKSWSCLQPIRPGVGAAPPFTLHRRQARCLGLTLASNGTSAARPLHSAPSVSASISPIPPLPRCPDQAMSISVAPPISIVTSAFQRTGRHSLQRFDHHHRRVRQHRVRR